MLKKNQSSDHRIQLRDPQRVYEKKLQYIITQLRNRGVLVVGKSAVIKRLIDEEEKRLSA